MIAKPLVQLTKTNVPFRFNKACWDAFKELKSRLTSSKLLYYYNPEKQLIIKIDASNGVIASVLL